MDVDANAVSPSGTSLPWLVPDKGPLHLAIVVTLALTALLIYSLRAFTRGKLLRSFAIDDGLMVLGTLCTIGIFITFTGVVELGLGQQEDGYVLPVGKTVQMGPWIWALNSLIIIGLGAVKLSATFTLLPLANTRSHPSLLMARTILLIGLMLLVFWHTIEWFISNLAQCVPLIAAWDLSYDDKALCMSQSESKHWALANYPINAVSSLLLVPFTVPIAVGSSLKLGATLHLLAVIFLGLFACATAIIRTWMVVTSWADIGYRNNFDLTFTTWSICEFLTAMIAVNLSTLLPLGRAIRSPESASRNAPRLAAISGPVAGSTVHLIHGDVDEVVPAYSEHYTSEGDNSYNSRYSGQTVIYRPDTAYFPSHFHSNNSLARFHDNESNLDFDIEAPSTRSSPLHRTMKAGPSSRFSVSTVSDWSQLSEYTHKDSDSEFEKEKDRRARVSGVELEEIVKSLGLKRHSSHGIWDKDLGPFEETSEDGGSSVAPTIFLEGDEDAEDGAGDVCTCPVPRVRNNHGQGDADDASLQTEADSSEITVIRGRGSARCALHKEEPTARPVPSRLNSGEWIARA